MKLKLHFGQLYQTLGQYHTKMIQMPNCPDRTTFAANLKSMLRMFITDLNQSLGIVDEPQPLPLEQLLPRNEDSQMNDLQDPELIGLIRVGSGAADERDTRTIEAQQRKLFEEIQRRNEMVVEPDICAWCAEEI